MSQHDTPQTAVESEYAAAAEQLGRKLWDRGHSNPLGGRILSTRQIAGLSAADRSTLRSGWLSWAYCNYGCTLLAGTDCYLITRKGA